METGKVQFVNAPVFGRIVQWQRELLSRQPVQIVTLPLRKEANDP